MSKINIVRKGQEEQKRPDSHRKAWEQNQPKCNQPNGFVTPTDTTRKLNEIFKVKRHLIGFVPTSIRGNSENKGKHQKVSKK